jgi:hypothetical protein
MANPKEELWMKKELEKKLERKQKRRWSEESPPTSTSVHSGLVGEEEETPANKKIRNKEKVHKKKNDAAKKKWKIEVEKSKSKAEVEAKLQQKGKPNKEKKQQRKQ